jgi:hypothetical protein
MILHLMLQLALKKVKSYIFMFNITISQKNKSHIYCVRFIIPFSFVKERTLLIKVQNYYTITHSCH